ncbi:MULTISPECIES: hypothetical protein [Pseudoalteromonas]|uniref:Uncharacterized protein n=1 Tax=Pseudoalteromonas amylolytica TaxID=1859457 RepID=A0A1S1N0J1_9GAMM|nr:MULTISPECIES: hypothetical protein [Pseudoalteromonas]OHU89203.1 hypothetical protein BFC16_06080 [Pseudoalteromonas sp. JW3]OHU92103.1 hypothetical protein BET10_07185 [Pseudoalteromonas amylolytica]
MHTKSKRDVVFVATDQQLNKKSYYRRLWVATRNIDLPRRLWLDEIADTLRDYHGLICHYNGRRFNVPVIDEVFQDSDMRWLSYFLSPDSSGLSPKMHVRKLERLRLIDLYFRIKHPHIADHFGR